MDTTNIVIIGILAIVVIGLAIRFRQSIKVRLGPLLADGTNVAIRSREISSKEGGVTLNDSTGKGVDADTIKANKDVIITTSEKDSSDPKV